MARPKKAPCIDIELDVRKDVRFEVLGSIAGYNRHEAVGRMFELWAWCDDRARERAEKGLPWEEPIVREQVIRLLLGPRGVEAILGDGVDEFALGVLQEDGRIYVRGTHRLAWRDESRATAKAGGEARARAPRDDSGRFVVEPTNVQRTAGCRVGVSPPIDQPYIHPTPASSSSSSSSSSTEEHTHTTRALPVVPVQEPVLRWCTERWSEVDGHRARVAKALGLEARPLHPFDRGRTELVARVRESGERAKADVEHVIAVRVAEAEAKQTVQWLSGRMFEGEQWRTALAMTVEDAKRTRAGPVRDVRVGRFEPGTEYPDGEQKF